MSEPTVAELREGILEIERSIDAKSYEPGPWAGFLRRARRLSVEQRREMRADVTRVSDKLHRHNHPGPTLSAKKAIPIEIIVLFGATADIFLGLHWSNPWIVGVAAFFVILSAQPVLKIFFGTMLGVRYSYFFLEFGSEPRAKMQYGTYLPLTSGQRVFLHATGMVGSVAAFLVIGYGIRGAMPTMGLALIGLGYFFAVTNLMFIVLGFAEVKKIQSMFSGGAMAREILGNRRALAAAKTPPRP